MPTANSLPKLLSYCELLFSDQIQTIYVKTSSYNVSPIAFSQLANSTSLTKDETVDNGDILNNLIDYKDGQKEPDYMRADEIHTGIQLFNKLEKHFLKIDTNSERSLKFQKEL
ncbi:uncharacterized protein TNCV_2357211 [Trichonephila clavipes]|nr:uncharacterized protein TNCV_2357211 [Trichonephila clavipes]